MGQGPKRALMNETSKRAYAEPSLVDYGSISKLTQPVVSGDGMGMGMGMGPLIDIMIMIMLPF